MNDIFGNLVPKSTASSAQMYCEKEDVLLALTQASLFDVVVPLVSSIQLAIAAFKTKFIVIDSIQFEIWWYVEWIIIPRSTLSIHQFLNCQILANRWIVIFPWCSLQSLLGLVILVGCCPLNLILLLVIFIPFSAECPAVRVLFCKRFAYDVNINILIIPGERTGLLISCLIS